MPIELAFSPKEQFEDNLVNFINNGTIVDEEKFILLQNSLQRVYKRKSYREKPLNENFIDQPPTSESSETLKTPKQ